MGAAIMILQDVAGAALASNVKQTGPRSADAGTGPRMHHGRALRGTRPRTVGDVVSACTSP